MKPIKLKSRIAIIAALPIIIMLLGLGWLFTNHQLNLIEQQFYQHLKLLSQTSATVIYKALKSPPREVRNKILTKASLNNKKSLYTANTLKLSLYHL